MKKYYLAFALGYASWANAQDSLRVIDLEAIAISAVRASADAPVPQTNVSSRQIEEKYIGQHPIFLLEDLTPGMFSYSESGSSIANYGQFRLRGINQERINLTLNGVPLNDMIDQGVFFSNFTDVTSNFESIQVQRGVGTSSNGVSSYGGSINFESINLRGKDKFSELQLGAGSFGTYRANFRNFTGISDSGWGFLTSFSKVLSDGYRQNTSTDATSFFMTGGYFGEKDVLKLTLFTGRSENGLGYYTIDESILDEDPTFNNLTENDQDDFRQHMIQLQYNRIINQEWDLGITGYYGGAGGDFAEGTPDVDTVLVENYFAQYRTTFFSINFPLRNDHFGAILNANYEKNDFAFSTGLHAYSFQRENEEQILPDRASPYYQDASAKNEVSWFGKATYEIGNLKAFADLQFRQAQLSLSPDFDWVGIAPEGDIQESWTFLNPKVGLTYKLGKDLSTYASFGRSGREPTRVDLLGGFQLNGDNYDLVKAGVAFEEEYVNDLEIGVRLNKQNFTLDANYYLMNFENEIAPIGEVIAFGLQRRENIPSSTRSGLEVQWTWAASDKLIFVGSGAYLATNITSIELDGEALSDREQILSPDWIVNGELKYRFIDQLSLSLSGRYIGEQFMELSNSSAFMVPSSFVIDCTVEASITENISISAFINNLADAQYYTYGAVSDVDFSGTLEPGFFIQPKQNFFLSATCRF